MKITKKELENIILEEIEATLREQEVLDRALGPTSGQLEPQLPSTEAPGNDVKKILRALAAGMKKNNRAIKTLTNTVNAVRKVTDDLVQGEIKSLAMAQQKQSNSTYANNNR